MFTKDHILFEIQRTAEQNGGKPLGIERFQTETGIKRSDWESKFWVQWGEALVEAGFKPNKLQGPRNDDELLGYLASFTRELGHFPVANEIKFKARKEPGFPWHNTFVRFGDKQSRATRLRDFCLQHDQHDVAAICDKVISRFGSNESANKDKVTESGETEIGFVYLMRSGRYYKIGRSNAVGRREREIAIQLPEKANVVHSIKTDDPRGIEAYWHSRFRERRKNGEWFELTANDVTAFKRRKFM